MLIHVGSASVTGSVPVTQSTILRSPVLVVVQARMVERDAGVDDADRHAAAVPGRVRVDELRGAGVASACTGSAAASPRPELAARRSGEMPSGRGSGSGTSSIDVERQHAVQVRRVLDLAGRDTRPHVAERLIGIPTDPPRPWSPATTVFVAPSLAAIITLMVAVPLAFAAATSPARASTARRGRLPALAAGAIPAPTTSREVIALAARQRKRLSKSDSSPWLLSP